MNRSEVMDLINEIEEIFPVDTWVVDDIHVWPLIRIPLAMNLYSQESTNNDESNLGQRKTFTRYISRIPKYLQGWGRQYRASVLDHSANGVLSNPAEIMFLTHTTCRNFVNHKWYDIFFDPLQDELNRSDRKSAIFEFAPGYEYRIPRYRKSVFIQNQIDAIKIKNKIWPKTSVVYNLAQYDEVKETVFINTGIKLPLISQVIRNATLIERLSYFWEDKLKVINPRLVFMVTYYGEIGMALNLACNRLSIPSVDIQHGVQGDYHVAYGRWSKVPLTGYELLPKVFWVWSGNEHAAIEQWCQPVKEHHRPIVGGNPWLSMWKEPNYHIVIEYDKILIKLMNKQPGQFNILYTLQPGYDPPEWLLNFIREAPLTWMWWIRLHPGMAADKLRIKELFANCRPNNIDIDNASIIPLPALLRHVNLHITQFSTTVIEAAEFGVPSIILDKDATLIYSKLIESGHAKYAMDVKSLVESMEYYIINKNGIPATNNITTDNVLFMLLENKSPEKGKVPIN